MVLFELRFWVLIQCISRFTTSFKTLSEKKQLLWYQVYAYGLPLILTIIIFVIDNIKSLPEHFQPNIGVVSCFISKKMNDLLFKWSIELLIWLFNSIRSLATWIIILLLPSWHYDHIECDFLHFDRNQFPSCASSS